VSVEHINRCSISVVIPAYNEGHRLPALVDQLVQAGLQASWPAVEFIVSDDGSAPEHTARQRASVEAAQVRLSQAGSPHRFVYVLAARNGGKGSAIRLGWYHASPESSWLAFLDADGSVGAGEFFRLAMLTATSHDVDVVAGSRILMAGRHIKRSLFRHLQGRVFATITDLNFQLRFYDTQCGVKFFRARLLKPLLGLLQEKRWLLDVEMLALLKKKGARAIEVPIDWVDVEGSKVVPGIDAVKMFWGIVHLRWRLESLEDRLH
jgi:dolichyl-phosphate beta-glucosyltransferase